MGRELEATLGDLGQVVETAGVEHRSRQVRVRAGDEVRQRQERHGHEWHRDDHQRRPPPASGNRRRGHRRSNREDDRRPHVGPEPPRSEDERQHHPHDEERRRRPPWRDPRRKPGQPRSSPGDDQHRQQRLQLVADPVEPHPQAGVRPQQRERGERRAGDDVDRVGEDGQPGSKRQRPVSAEQRQRQPREQRRPKQHQELFDRLARLERRADQQQQRQIDDREPDHPNPRPGGPAPRYSHRQSERDQPDGEANPDHRPPSRGDRRQPISEGDHRPHIDRALRANRLPRHLRGHRDPEPMQDRRRDVGREHVPVQPSAVGSQVPVEPMPGDSDRQRLVVGRRRRLDRDQEIVAAQIPDQGRELPQGQASNSAAPWLGGGRRVSLNFFEGPDRRPRSRSAKKCKRFTPTRTPTPAASKLDASRPGTMSAGRSPPDRPRPPEAGCTCGRFRVVERVEDSVALRDVEVSLPSGHRPQPSAEQCRRDAPNPRQLLHPGPSGHEEATGAPGGRGTAAPQPRSNAKVRSSATTERYREPDGRPHFRKVHVFQG